MRVRAIYIMYSMKNEFHKYATRHLGINSMVLDDVISAQNQYLNPYILEERQLNVTQMDVFSRLMMDRIIFLGTQIDDYTANTLQAQLLYLDSTDPGKDISIYINDSLLTKGIMPDTIVCLDINRFAEEHALMVVNNQTDSATPFNLDKKGSKIKLLKKDNEIIIEETPRTF